MSWKRGPKKAKPVVEDIEKIPEDGAVLWSDMPSRLKPTIRQQKPIEREKLEEVELKPSKIQKSTIERETLEDVSLKPVSKDVTEETQIAEITEIDEEGEKEKQKSKTAVKVKKSKEKETDADKEINAHLEVETIEEVSHAYNLTRHLKIFCYHFHDNFVLLKKLLIQLHRHMKNTLNKHRQ